MWIVKQTWRKAHHEETVSPEEISTHADLDKFLNFISNLHVTL